MMMLDYYINKTAPARNGELFSYCNDENVDYLYTAAVLKERRNSHKTFAFFKGHIKKRSQMPETSRQCCAQYLHEPKGLKL